MRATKVRGSEGLTSIYGIAASLTKLVVSAGYLNAAGILDPKRCGLYELILASGEVNKIANNSSCHYKSSWNGLSLSPDGRQLIAVREHRLELIDLETKAIKSLGDGFLHAAWSPDGRWIMALEYEGKNQSVLIDSSDLDKRSEFPSSEGIWAPDSHHILASRTHARCPPGFGTLELIDIESGKTSIIESSTCKINRLVFGWVNLGIR